MPNYETCAYRILRYTPNLVRDEWVNIGVILYEPAGARLKLRLIEEDAEFARVRRLHPRADLNLLRALQADLQAQFDRYAKESQKSPPQRPAGFVARLEEALSNVLQLSPQKGLLAEDFDAALDRLYREQIEPPRFQARAAAEPGSRNGIRMRAREVFRQAGILSRMQSDVRVEEFTFPGDPMKLDFSYRRNGTQGFAHALALARDPAQAKVLSFTAERMRAKLATTEFTALTEVEPRPENDRHRFVAGLLREQGISIMPVAMLPEFANRLRPELR